MSELNKIYGYSNIVTNSVLVRIIKCINKILQQRVDDLYSEISKEGRVQSRWGNEYRLFLVVSKFVPNAYYQYRCAWLGKQSFDIYLETYKVAIEYQGQQHYEAISLFGGEEGLLATQERDRRKRELAEEHDVTLLEWEYTMEITDDRVAYFLKKNGIDVVINHETEISNDLDEDSKVIMAPVKNTKKTIKKVEKRKALRESKVVVVCYNLEGKLVKQYKAIGEASECVGISGTSISKVIRGERNTAGGYIWRRYDIGMQIPKQIEIDFDINLINSGASKKVAKIDESGVILESYSSIMEAARKSGIEIRTIQKKLKQCKGWIYVNDEDTEK